MANYDKERSNDFEKLQSKCKYRGQCQLIQGKGGVRKPGQVGQDCWKRGLKTQNKSACICVLASSVAFQLAYSPEVISHHLFGGAEVMRIIMLKTMLEKNHSSHHNRTFEEASRCSCQAEVLGIH